MVGVVGFILLVLWMPLGAMNQVFGASFDQRAVKLLQTFSQEASLLTSFEQLLAEVQERPSVYLPTHTMVFHKLASKPTHFFTPAYIHRWKTVIEKLLARSALVDVVASYDTTTPFYWAVKNKHVWLVEILLAHGADAKRCFVKGVPIPGNALHVAVRQYKKTAKDDLLINLLLQAGLHPYVCDGTGLNALHLTNRLDLKERLRIHAEQHPFVQRFPVRAPVRYHTDAADNDVLKREAYAAVVRYSEYAAGGPDGLLDLPESGCPICYEGAGEWAGTVQLPCHQGHRFHAHCLEPWVVQKANCPLCRGLVDAGEIVLLYTKEEGPD